MKANGPKVTLQSIANALGVSKTTVSNAYNNTGHLSAQLRSEILRTAEQLGYVGPNPIARLLSTGQVMAVGLTFTDSLSYAISDPAAAKFLEGLTLACEDAALSLMLIPALPRQQQGISMLDQAPIDGLVVYSAPNDSELIRSLTRSQRPVVIVDEPEPLANFDWIGLDDQAGFQAVGAYLFGMGHRNVAVACTRLSLHGHRGEVTPAQFEAASYSVQRNRIIGLRLAGASVGKSVRIDIHEEFDNTTSAGEKAGHAILDHNPSITAIACTTDVLAIGVMEAARQRGMRIPQQLTVTGHDDIPEAARSSLTTIRQPLVTKGRRAGELLLSYTDRRRPRHEVLGTDLVVRGSSGPPRHPSKR